MEELEDLAKKYLLGLIKNVQMQVESAKSRLRGHPCLRPARRGYAQAGEVLRRERFKTVLYTLYAAMTCPVR